MASTAEIVVKFADSETIDLIRVMAAEIQNCYDHLDEVAALLGEPSFPRNPDVLEKIDAWRKSLEVPA